LEVAVMLSTGTVMLSAEAVILSVA